MPNKTTEQRQPSTQSLSSSRRQAVASSTRSRSGQSTERNPQNELSTSEAGGDCIPGGRMTGGVVDTRTSGAEEALNLKTLTVWAVADCWSQSPAICHLRRMKNPVPGCRAQGSQLRLLLGPDALWRLTRRACLQRLHLERCTWHSQRRANAGPLLTWVPRFLPPHLNVSIRLEWVGLLRRNPK